MSDSSAFLCFIDRGHADESKISEKDEMSYARDGGHYAPAPELDARPGIPRGAIAKYYLANSKEYPGVGHDYWIYVPAQYHGDTPASLLIVLDGEGYLSGEVPIPVLMDNLIHDGQIPVMIVVFLNAGPDGPGYPIYGGSGNRAVEYDSADGKYAEFIVEELLPRIKARYNISDDPSHHGIMGGSSGGSAAFGVAWHRPDEFRRGISIVGSFVNIRGADAYAWMIRRADRKPIRIYLRVFVISYG